MIKEFKIKQIVKGLTDKILQFIIYFVKLCNIAAKGLHSEPHLAFASGSGHSCLVRGVFSHNYNSA